MGIEKLKALANTAGLKRTTLNKVGSTTKTPDRKQVFITEPDQKAEKSGFLDLLAGE
jgi:hypothetical protein